MSTIKKIIALLITISTITVMLCTPANAISDTCIENHFSELERYVESNQFVTVTPPSENTCPYVAMSLILTYYDSYWNDSFVDDEYEWNRALYSSRSDNLIRTFAAIDEAQAWDNYIESLNLGTNVATDTYYRNYALQNSSVNNYLEPYLVALGCSLYLHQNPNDTLGLAYYEAASVLRYYLIGIQGFSESAVSVNFRNESDYDVISKMKEIIKKGYPVYYSGKRIDSDGEKSGHAMVAYGIDVYGNIMLHTGWAGNEHRILLVVPGTEEHYRSNSSEEGDEPVLTNYTLNKSIIWLELDEDIIQHTHSYNYLDSDTGESLCSCQIYKFHPEHENNHRYFVKTDSLKRWEECGCGNTRNTHVHEKNYTIDSLELHSEECSICDYEAQVEHTFYLKSLNSIYHIEECECGMVGEITEHAESKYSKQNNTSHSILCNCGYVMGTASHSLVPFGNQRYKCTDCGALFNASSDIIIKKDDPEYEVE